MNILVIDDDAIIRDSLAFYFESEGCTFRIVGTAEEGFDALADEEFDAVICDYRLPGMDGIEFFKIMNESRPGVKKILITAYMNEVDMAETMELGIKNIVSKPLRTEILQRALGQPVKQSVE